MTVTRRMSECSPGSNFIFTRPQSLNQTTDRWVRKINAKKRTEQTQALVQRPVRLYRICHNKLSSSSGTYNISSSNNLRDRKRTEQTQALVQRPVRLYRICHNKL